MARRESLWTPAGRKGAAAAITYLLGLPHVSKSLNEPLLKIRVPQLPRAEALLRTGGNNGRASEIPLQEPAKSGQSMSARGWSRDGAGPEPEVRGLMSASKEGTLGAPTASPSASLPNKSPHSTSNLYPSPGHLPILLNTRP